MCIWYKFTNAKLQASIHKIDAPRLTNKKSKVFFKFVF